MTAGKGEIRRAAGNGYHTPVMLSECADGLSLKAGGLYLDGTLGGGGHAYEILRRTSPDGELIGIDKDLEAIENCKEKLKEFGGRVAFIRGDFKENVPDAELDGAILDLGVSSRQIDEAERGFSYRFDGPLDMRMDRTAFKTAREVINGYSEEELVRIFFEYGEERFSKRIAAAVVKNRKVKPIETTGALAKITESAVPAGGGGHPAKRVFQAVRIEVNGELDGLGAAVEKIAGKLKRGGRMCVLTFHSLEDRAVKKAFAGLAAGCVCDKALPVCVCGHKASVKLIGKYAAGAEELRLNPRAASCTLRVIEKV